MWRGWKCERLEECYNPHMLADRGDAERGSATVVFLVEIDIIPCEQ